MNQDPLVRLNDSNRRLCRRMEPLEPRRVLAPLLPSATEAGPPVPDLVTASVDPHPPAAIVNGTLTDDFPAVGIVNDTCSGTLISPRHVLTAAHCTNDVQESQGTFRTGDTVVGTLSQMEHPQFDPDFYSLANDVAVMVLDAPITGIAPYAFLREAPLVGEMLTLVGFGDGGTTGRPDHDFPTKRFGRTELEEVSDIKIFWTFHGDGESNTAPGDSGGPALVEREGGLVIAGVTSGGEGDPWNIGGDLDYAWNTRVDAFADWIDAVVSAELPEPRTDDHADQPRLGATKIALSASGGWESGVIRPEGDRDAFQFSVSSPTRVTVTVVSTDGELDSILRLHGSEGLLLQSNDDLAAGTNTNSRLVRTLAAGTYFVTVGAYSDEGTGNYAVVIDLGIERETDQHADTSTSAATDLAIDADGHAAVSGRLETHADRDVFEFTVPETTPATIAAVATDVTLDPYLRVYDQAGLQIASNNDGPAGDDSLVQVVLQPGTYFASVGSLIGASLGTYILSLQIDPTEIDLFADVEPVSLDVRGRALVAGTVSEPGDFVAYSFVSRFTGVATATTRAAQATTDTRIAVYDADRNELVAHSDRSLTNLNGLVEFEVRENEQYFVVVAGEAGTVGDYWLTIRTAAAFPPTAVTGAKGGAYVRPRGVTGVLTAATRVESGEERDSTVDATSTVRPAAMSSELAGRDAVFAAWCRTPAAPLRPETSFQGLTSGPNLSWRMA